MFFVYQVRENFYWSLKQKLRIIDQALTDTDMQNEELTSYTLTCSIGDSGALEILKWILYICLCIFTLFSNNKFIDTHKIDKVFFSSKYVYWWKFNINLLFNKVSGLGFIAYQSLYII